MQINLVKWSQAISCFGLVFGPRYIYASSTFGLAMLQKAIPHDLSDFKKLFDHFVLGFVVEGAVG